MVVRVAYVWCAHTVHPRDFFRQNFERDRFPRLSDMQEGTHMREEEEEEEEERSPPPCMAASCKDDLSPCEAFPKCACPVVVKLASQHSLTQDSRYSCTHEHHGRSTLPSPLHPCDLYCSSTTSAVPPLLIILPRPSSPMPCPRPPSA